MNLTMRIAAYGRIFIIELRGTRRKGKHESEKGIRKRSHYFIT